VIETKIAPIALSRNQKIVVNIDLKIPFPAFREILQNTHKLPKYKSAITAPNQLPPPSAGKMAAATKNTATTAKLSNENLSRFDFMLITHDSCPLHRVKSKFES
jgi:hypothetical protein